MPGFDLGELFKNKLFLQYLSGAGAAMQRGDPISAGLDPITQKTIGAQSQAGESQRMMKMISALMGDKLKGDGGLLGPGKDFKSDAAGKVTVTDGTKKVSGTLGDVLGETALGGLDEGLAETGGLSPFVSSLPSFADLAGLGPEDVSRALTGAVRVEQLRADVPYKRALTKQAVAAAGRRPAGAALDDPFYIPGPGGRKLSLRQWNSLTSDQKEYRAYVYQANQLDDKDIMSPREYKQTPITQRAQFLQEIIDDPALKDVAIELAKAGAPTIGELKEREKVKDVIGERAYLTDPKGMTKDLEKHINSEEVQNRLFALDPDQRAAEVTREKVRYIESKIASSGATIVNVTIDEKGVMTWAIEFPDGETKEISYAVRP